MVGTEVGSLYYDLDINSDKLDKSLSGADKKIKDFGDNISKSGEQLKANLTKTAVGLAAVGAGLTLVAKNATDYTVNAVKDAKALGRQIGTSTEEASRLTAAFGRMGVSADSASQMFGIFSKNIVSSTKDAEKNRLASESLKIQIDQTKVSISDTTAEIKKHGDKSGELSLKVKELTNNLATQQEKLKETKDGFQKLGVSTLDASGTQKDFTSILFEVANKFKTLPNGVDKTALALELFGRQGKDLLPVLNLGGSGIQELEKQADELGLTLDQNTIGKVNAFIQSQKDLKQNTDAMKIAIGTATAPILTAFNQELSNMVNALLSGNPVVADVTANIIAFGGPTFTGAAALLELGSNAAGAWPLISKVGGAIFSLQALSLTAWGTAIAADLYLIVKAAQAVAQAMSDIDAKDRSKKSLDSSLAQNRKEMEQLARTGTPAQKAAANKYLKSNQYAKGTDSAAGGLSWVGEKGPELMNIPRGAQIIPNDLIRKMADGMGQGNTTNNSPVTFNIGTVQDRSDADYIINRVDRNQLLANSGGSRL